jgi:hypothetical protein
MRFSIAVVAGVPSPPPAVIAATMAQADRVLSVMSEDRVNEHPLLVAKESRQVASELVAADLRELGQTFACVIPGPEVMFLDRLATAARFAATDVIVGIPAGWVWSWGTRRSSGILEQLVDELYAGAQVGVWDGNGIIVACDCHELHRLRGEHGGRIPADQFAYSSDLAARQPLETEEELNRWKQVSQQYEPPQSESADW